MRDEEGGPVGQNETTATVWTVEQVTTLLAGAWKPDELKQRLAMQPGVARSGEWRKGVLLDREVWRFDFWETGVAPYFITGKASEYRGPISPAYELLKPGYGNLSMQLFIDHGVDGDTPRALLYYRDEADQVQSMLSYADGLFLRPSEQLKIVDHPRFQIKGKIRPVRPVLGYENPISSSLQPNFLAMPDQDYEVKTIAGEYVELYHRDGFSGWVPAWYATGNAARMKNIAPKI